MTATVSNAALVSCFSLIGLRTKLISSTISGLEHICALPLYKTIFIPLLAYSSFNVSIAFDISFLLTSSFSAISSTDTPSPDTNNIPSIILLKLSNLSIFFLSCHYINIIIFIILYYPYKLHF